MIEENVNDNVQEQGGEQIQEQSQEQVQEQSQEQQGYDFTGLNELYKDKIGENPLDESSFTSLIESRSKLSEFEQELQAKNQELQSAMEYKAKYESFLEKFDSDKLTPNKEALALSQLSDKHKEADMGVLSKVRSSDISTIDPLDGLVLANKLKVPGNYSDSDRKSVILQKLGIEEGEEGEATNKLRIQTAFADEKNILAEIKNFQPEGVDFDFEAESKAYRDGLESQRQELTTHNKKALDILLDSYKETSMTVKDDKGNDVKLNYSVDDDFRESYIETALKDLESSGFKITDQNASEVMARVDQDYRNKNMQKMVQHFINQVTTSLKESQHNENHNDSETNRTEAPTDGVKEFKTLREQFAFKK